jgi:prophage antirepressor-like protein
VGKVPGFSSGVLADIAKVLAATDPDRAAQLIADAERAAQSITSRYKKALTLTDVAEALAATDPDRAAQLIADAERAAQSITSKNKKAVALADVAEALAVTDPDRAERIAQLITDEVWKARALVTIAETWSHVVATSSS